MKEVGMKKTILLEIHCNKKRKKIAKKFIHLVQVRYVGNRPFCSWGYVTKCVLINN